MTVITIDIPADRTDRAAIFEPVTFASGPTNQPYPQIYMIRLPLDPRLDGCRISDRDVQYYLAKSTKKPIIMIGEDNNYKERLLWNILTEKARMWNIPFNELLIGRPIRVAVERWTPRHPLQRTAYDSVNLVGVQILGDLEKSDHLEKRIAEIRAMFDRD